MKFRFYIPVFSLLSSLPAVLSGQNNIPGIHGWITDKETGERIENAIVIDSGDLQYTYSNRDGYYNMGMGSGRHAIIFTAVGYKTARITEDIYRAREINMELMPMDEMESDTNWNKYHAVFDIRSGHLSLARNQILQMPAIANIPDPVKFVQYLPGVSGGIEGLSGLYVRGGNSDQNLITMDGLPIYGNGHIFGFLSAFNPDLVGNTEFYRGVAPARYGGRAGAVLDISMREGGTNEWRTSYNQDFLLMNFSGDGPITSDGRVTGSFGLRRSWFDLFIPKGGDNYAFYNLHDINAKIVARVGRTDKLSFFVYNGRDKLATRAEGTDVDSLGRSVYNMAAIGFNWQNTLTGVTWSHKFNNRHYGNFTGGMSRATYRFPFELQSSITSDTSFSDWKLKFNVNNAITDGILRADLEYRLAGNAHLRYGGEVILHHFRPTLQEIELSSKGNRGLDTTYGESNIQTSLENSLYAEYEKNLGAGLKLNIGGRLWTYAAKGKTWIRPEPRIMVSQILQGQKAIKLGFSMANQGVHRLSSVNGNLPGDVWFPTTGKIRPQRTMQLTAGFYQPWRRGWEFSMDVYWKQFDGVTDLTGQDEGSLTPNYWERMLSQGSGKAYGAEFLLMKKVGRFNGLAGYTIARSDRQIDDINFGEAFPFRWDRRHKFTLEGAYTFNEVWRINFAAVVMSGNAVTVPTGKYMAADGSMVFDYSSKNNFRMPLYKRIDFGFSKQIKPELDRYFDSYWGINIYNVAGWKNPLFVRVDQTAGAPAEAFGLSFFPFIPSAFYRVVF